jgi:hypothetical protein
VITGSFQRLGVVSMGYSLMQADGGGGAEPSSKWRSRVWNCGRGLHKLTIGARARSHVMPFFIAFNVPELAVPTSHLGFDNQRKSYC